MNRVPATLTARVINQPPSSCLFFTSHPPSDTDTPSYHNLLSFPPFSLAPPLSPSPLLPSLLISHEPCPCHAYCGCQKVFLWARVLHTRSRSHCRRGPGNKVRCVLIELLLDVLVGWLVGGGWYELHHYLTPTPISTNLLPSLI